MKGLRYKHLAPMVVFATTLIMSGCSLTGGNSGASDEKSALKVMYYDERSFYDQYGTLYSALHPNVELTVVSNQSFSNEPIKDPDAELQKFIDKENPDILMLGTDQLTKFAKDGKLLDLDTLVGEKDYHQETLIPGLIDYMKELGDGKVYGLSTNFYSQAIFYNKDLFEKYGIALPQDKMSWEQLFQLAQRFPTDGAKDKRVYGLNLGYNADPYQLGSMIGTSQNLTMFIPASGQVTINSASWKKVFQTAVDALKSGSMYTEDPNSNGSMAYEDYLLRDPFIGGRLAMKFESTYLMDQIKEAQTRVKDKAIKNWDIVTVPVDPQNPDSSANMSFGQIFAINAKSVNADAAKEFIRYITGEEYARVTSKVNSGGFSVRTTYLKDDANHNMQAFYMLKPVQNNMYKDYDKLPPNFFQRFTTIAQQELKSALDGKQSVDAALDKAQVEAQQAMTEEVANEKNKPAAGASSSTEGSASTDAVASDSATATTTVTK